MEGVEVGGMPGWQREWRTTSVETRKWGITCVSVEISAGWGVNDSEPDPKIFQRVCRAVGGGLCSLWDRSLPPAVYLSVSVHTKVLYLHIIRPRTVFFRSAYT